MDLVEFHHSDGRPVMIDRESVSLMEPHISGAGTFLMIGSPERPHEMHLREDYETVKGKVTETVFERALARLREKDAKDKAQP